MSFHRKLIVGKQFIFQIFIEICKEKESIIWVEIQIFQRKQYGIGKLEVADSFSRLDKIRSSVSVDSTAPCLQLPRPSYFFRFIIYSKDELADHFSEWVEVESSLIVSPYPFIHTPFSPFSHISRFNSNPKSRFFVCVIHKSKITPEPGLWTWSVEGNFASAKGDMMAGFRPVWRSSAPAAFR